MPSRLTFAFAPILPRRLKDRHLHNQAIRRPLRRRHKTSVLDCYFRTSKRPAGSPRSGLPIHSVQNDQNKPSPIKSPVPLKLREAIQRGKTLVDLQNVWDLCFALKNNPLLICIGENPSLEDLWRAYIQYEQIEENVNAVKVLSRVGRRYHLVHFYGSYKREQLQAGKTSGKHSKVKADFIAKMFPKTQKRRKYTQHNCQDPQMYVARRLSDLVTRFGRGVLLYPGFDMTIYDIAKVTNDHINDLVDLIHKYHSGLKDELSNLSKVLPKMIIWGAPASHLVIEQIPKDRLAEHQARSMNDLIQFYDIPEEGRIQGEPDFNEDMSKWHGSVAGIEW
ncbi:unnamed protein product [Fusarium langsethiae]|nr:unnamed protein product [Fusarium langsethiae]